MCDMTNNGITMKIQHVAYVGIQNVLRKFPVAGSKTDCDIHPLWHVHEWQFYRRQLFSLLLAAAQFFMIMI